MALVKTQIYLEAEQQKILKDLARQEHVSFSGLVRDAMDRYISLFKIATEKKQRKSLSIIGIGASGLTDVSENHDKYVGEAIAKEHNIR
jgi:hypothetical protein